MAFYDHLIIGGGIAGVSAAEVIRQRDPRRTILVLGAEKHPLYSRVLLPHIADGRAKAGRAMLKSPATLAASGIGYETGAEVHRVDAVARTATLADGTSIGYGKLLIASGSAARRFPGPGGEHCMSFRALDDLDAFEAAVAAGSVVVYGGGFNAIDLAASFVRRGVRVTAVMRGDGYLARVMDPASKEMIRTMLVAHGIEIRPLTELIAVEKRGSHFSAYLSGNIAIECGAVAVSLGVTPNVGFLAGSGIPVGRGVLTDERLAATPDVFAAGDVAEYLDVHFGDRRIAGNWQNAMFQGKTAGANMAGDATTFGMVTSYSIPCFELPVSVVGAIDDAGDMRIVRHAAGVGALQLVLKGGRVVGATCVGPFSDRAAVTKLIGDDVSFGPSMIGAARDVRIPLASLIP